MGIWPWRILKNGGISSFDSNKTEILQELYFFNFTGGSILKQILEKITKLAKHLFILASDKFGMLKNILSMLITS